MEKSESTPLEPTKPPEIDPELNATAATAVEQWRNYQQAYAAYQQQYASYQQYIQQRQYAQTVEQQQMAYSQYLEQHSQYQYQLQQYEQHHHQQQPIDPMTSWSAEPYTLSNPMMVQQPGAPTVHPTAGPMNGYSGMLPSHQPVSGYVATDAALMKGAPGKSVRESRSKYRGHEKKSELHTKTIVYVNPEDETMLPADLKKLFKDLQCDLCRTRMNSHISANIHYQSRAHEKKINQWLKEYCAETGTPLPVRVRRQPELATEATAVIGQSVFHCETCDLPLTSIQHANQHYTGKRHWMVVNGKKLPSGNGFYNGDGKWTRSGNIVADQTVAAPSVATKRFSGMQVPNGAKHPRLEPPPIPPKELVTGVNWLPETPSTSTSGVKPQTAPPAMVAYPVAQAITQPLLTINVESDDEDVKVVTAQPAAADVFVAAVAPVAVAPVLEHVTVSAPPQGVSKPATTTLEQEIRKKDGLDCVDETGTFCLICETSVTSRSEMLMHLKGAKHIKKARMKGVAVRTTPFNPTDTILKSLSKPVRKTDWSLYRMPSGKFYCKTCNLIVADEKLFGQHWYGKKHKLKMRQEQSGQQKRNGATTSSPPTDAATVVSPFASDDIALAPVTETESVETTPGKAAQKRFNRPFFFAKRARMAKPRKPFPVPN